MSDLEECPNCGFKFSRVYSRMIACSDCERSAEIGGCGYIKCPSCGNEYEDKRFPERFLERKKYRQFL